MFGIYWTLFKTSLALQFQYRAEMIIWLMGLVIQPVIYLAVWIAVARSQGGAVGGYTSGDFAAYFLVMMVVHHLTFTWNMFVFEYRVRTGEFSPLLLQPLHPLHRDVAENIAFKTITMVVLAPTTLALVLVFEPRMDLVPWRLAAFLPTLALAFVLRFFVEWSLALAAFWTTRVAALNQVYFFAMLFLAGRMAPLELMPAWVQQMAWLSPFRWMLAFPVELVLGHLSVVEIQPGLVAQAVWILLGFGLLSLVWGRGAKRYSAVGS